MYCEEDNGGIAVLVDGEGTLKQTEQERYLEGGRVEEGILGGSGKV
jgi:hypothetical protein